MLTTRFTELVGCSVPIQQAGMGSHANPRLDVADEIVATNYINHNPAPGETPGVDGLKQFISVLLTAFPDRHFIIEDQVAEGDEVTTRFSVTGTHQGLLPAFLQPAGRSL